MHDPTISLPIDGVLQELRQALTGARRLILSAAPGAGKTTRVPIALLDHPGLANQRILMLEPRRLAARRAAEFMASLLGEQVGQAVGYRIRGESKTGPATRIEVVTEGILTRMLHEDPALTGIGLVIFDEFHERSIHADLGLALVLDVQDHLRENLRLLVMSATLDGVALQSLMPDAQVVECPGRLFPVETQFAAFRSDKPIEVRVAETVRRVSTESDGDILVFLPGQREILRTESILHERPISSDEFVIHSLFGDAPSAQQLAALNPDPNGRRKIILSTNVAETSLTIDGIRTVIDSGLMRVSRFDPNRGMSGLATVPVSRASADQRRGRAGRLSSGLCVRLWTEQEHSALPAYNQPEIKTADLAPLALDLALWGDARGASLRFLDPPPSAHLQQAQRLLQRLEALDETLQLTSHGKTLARFPTHPRLAEMIVRGSELGCADDACLIAASLEERNPGFPNQRADIDLESRLHALNDTRRSSSAAYERIRAQARRLRQLISKEEAGVALETPHGTLLALAYPERIGKQRTAGSNRYQLAGGGMGVLPESSLLAREQFLAIADADGANESARVLLAAPLSVNDLRLVFETRITREDESRWDPQTQSVIARRVERLEGIELREFPIQLSDADATSAMAEGIRSMGIDVLPWTQDARAFQQRSEWIRIAGFAEADWPVMSNEQLFSDLEQWCGGALSSLRRREHLASLPLLQLLKARFTHAQLQQLDRLAPAHILLPTGTKARIDYSVDPPVLAVRLQELFGQTDTPRIAGGRIPLVLHLLSPAQRPLAVTKDLASFWATTYPEIRRQMRARYPRHVWPDDPMTAPPTSRPKRRQR